MAKGMEQMIGGKMRSILRLGALLMFAAITAAIFFSEAAQAQRARRGPSKLVSARSLYIQNCARCHGANGKSQTALGRKLEAADLTDPETKSFTEAKITRIIRNGRPDMPAFGKKLSAKQIASIAGYIRSL